MLCSTTEKTSFTELSDKDTAADASDSTDLDNHNHTDLHRGQSTLRLELLDVQCRGNLWQDRPCLCPLLVSGVKRPNQRS